MLPAITAVAAFNLVCSGTYTTSLIDKTADMGVKDIKILDKTYVVRVDLSAKRWCIDRCATTTEIAEVSERQITLDRYKPADLPLERLFILNRESGTFFYAKRAGDFSEVSQGSCTVAPFSGFPALKF